MNRSANRILCLGILAVAFGHFIAGQSPPTESRNKKGSQSSNTQRESEKLKKFEEWQEFAKWREFQQFNSFGAFGLYRGEGTEPIYIITDPGGTCYTFPPSALGPALGYSPRLPQYAVYPGTGLPSEIAWRAWDNKTYVITFAIVNLLLDQNAAAATSYTANNAPQPLLYTFNPAVAAGLPSNFAYTISSGGAACQGLTYTGIRIDR